MAKDSQKVPNFDEIVFKIRNKEYGAYVLRKKYKSVLTVAMLIGILMIATGIITPYLNAKVAGNRVKRTERQVEIKLEKLDAPVEKVAPPPSLPPPVDVVQQQRYVPPQIVDSIKPEDVKDLMTADQAQVEVTNKDVIEVVQTVKEEVQEEEAEPQPFIVVEEMPTFPGGEGALLKYLADHTIYPTVAQENNIEGKVMVRFCVTSKGGVDLVSVSRSIDPALDAEALRVVRALPRFNPGKQGGKPVPVWYTVPIIFKIIN